VRKISTTLNIDKPYLWPSKIVKVFVEVEGIKMDYFSYFLDFKFEIEFELKFWKTRHPNIPKKSQKFTIILS
jgi:hypothetical protein